MNSTKLGSRIISNLWVYYRTGSTTSVAQLGTSYAYITTDDELGTQMNTGIVYPIPSTLPINTPISITAYDYRDNIDRSLDIFIDNFPGAYIGNGYYTNSSNYSTYFYQGETDNYFANLTGNHTLYIAITQYEGSYYGNYSGTLTINDTSSTDFSGLDATHILEVNVTDGTIDNSSVITVP